MVEQTVKQLAERIGITPQALLEKMSKVGIDVQSEDDLISQANLALYLGNKGSDASSVSESDAQPVKRKKLSLNKKQPLSTGKTASHTGVKIVRKKRIPSDATVRNNIEIPLTKHHAGRVIKVQQPSKGKKEEKAQPPADQRVEGADKQTVDVQATVLRDDTVPAVHKPKKFTEKGPSAPPAGRKSGVVKKKKNERVYTESKRAQQIAEKAFTVESALSQKFEKPVSPAVKEIRVPETIVVSELAKKLSVKVSDVIRILMDMGVMATINQSLDQDTAALLIDEMGHKSILTHDDPYQETLDLKFDDSEQYAAEPRLPVVTVMGHVDHGKTTFLDYLRRTKVTDNEAGGITQHMGAYRVSTQNGGEVTFIDTPGHEAFTQMRARGVKSTDIVILIVAADDGVMPQTLEALQHAKAAEVPIVVAMNKIDRPNADPERIKTELAQHNIVPEEWGGENIFMPISAKTGEGVDALVESLLVQAEVLELKARTQGAAKGVVVESCLDKGRGIMVTVLVQEGKLHKGDVLLIGKEYGRVRAMKDDRGMLVATASPGTPVEILGMSGLPDAGDEVLVLKSERQAREVALYRQTKYRERVLTHIRSSSVSEVFDQLREGELKLLNIVIKADVNGSLEAIVSALQELSTDEIRVKVIGRGVGAITETDVNLSVASSAILIGFNVRADEKARQCIEREGTDVRYYSVIYNLIDEIRSAVEGMKPPVVTEKILGTAEVREVYYSSKMGSIAGCMVLTGQVKRRAKIRVLRDSVVIFKGELESLRRYEENANEVRQGMECGIGVKDYNDIIVNDQIECYVEQETAANA